MAMRLSIEYEQLIELVEQLSETQRQDLLARLLAQSTNVHSLTPAEKIKRLKSAQIHQPVNETPSIRREDWYDDDGR